MRLILQIHIPMSDCCKAISTANVNFLKLSDNKNNRSSNTLILGISIFERGQFIQHYIQLHISISTKVQHSLQCPLLNEVWAISHQKSYMATPPILIGRVHLHLAKTFQPLPYSLATLATLTSVLVTTTGTLFICLQTIQPNSEVAKLITIYTD